MTSRTRADREHEAAVAALGCCLCGGEAELHHVRRDGMPRHLAPVVGLCPYHHRLGGQGVAVHAGRESWEREHGPEQAWVVWTNEQLEPGGDAHTTEVTRWH